MRRKIVILLSLMVVFFFCLNLAAEAGGKGGSVYVRGYHRKNGTYVAPHYRSAPDANPYNNWSYPGNVNPYTGKVAPGNPDTYLKNYYNRSPTKTYSPYTSPSLPSYSNSSTPKHPTPNYNPLPNSSNPKGTGLENLFGTKQTSPIKQRSNSLTDVF